LDICTITTREHHTKEKENTSLTGLDFRKRRRSCALVRFPIDLDGLWPQKMDHPRICTSSHATRVSFMGQPDPFPH
jgi:hypothetical protein